MLTVSCLCAANGCQKQKIHEADAPEHEVLPVHQDCEDRQGDTDGVHLAREHEPKGQGCPVANATHGPLSTAAASAAGGSIGSCCALDKAMVHLEQTSDS